MNDKSIKILFNLSLILLIVTSVASVGAANPELQWYATIGSSSSNEVAYSVLQTEDGGFILAGSKSTPANGLDFYLAKTSSNGTVEWEKSYGGYADDCANSLAESSDGGYVLVGYTKSFGAGGYDVMMLKTDSSGEQEWFMTFGGARDDVGQSVKQTTDGGFIIAGGSRSFDPSGSYDFYLIATGPTGNLIWEKTFGGTDYEYANCVQQTTDGGFIIAGGTGIFLSYVKDVLLVKTDSLGTPQWSKTYGASGSENAYSVIQTSDGGYLIAGYTHSYGSNEEAYLVKTNTTGALVWQNYFGGEGDERANSVIQTTDGEYLLVGYTKSYGTGLADVYLVKVDQSGNLKTMNAFGGVNDDYGYDIIQLQDGSCAIAGETRSFLHAPTQDAYLIKTNIFIDSLPPQLADRSPVASSIINTNTPTIGASFDDITGVDVSSVRVYLDSVDITALCTITVDAFSYTNWGLSTLAEGTHTVSIAASDTNGNAGDNSWSFIVDSQAPTISAFMPLNHSSISSTRPFISATFNDTVGVNVSGVAVRFNFIDVTSSAQITASGIQYVPPSDLGQGLNTVTLIVPDLAGNSATVSWTFRVDTVAPTISSISPSNGATIQAIGDSRVTISASYSDNAEVASGSIKLMLDGVDITGSATVTTTAISCNRDVGPGVHTVQLTVVDGAGNTSTTTANFTVNNLMPIVIIAAISFIALIAVLLLLSRRKKSKVEELPKWEQPTPPPPPVETYVPKQEPKTIAEEVKEVQYTPPLPEEQLPAQSPEPVPEEPKAIEEPPQPPAQALGTTAIESAPSATIAPPEKAPETKTCPECGKKNKIGASYCWYCDRSFE